MNDKSEDIWELVVLLYSRRDEKHTPNEWWELCDEAEVSQ